jgi:hypothetical protein
MGMAASSYRYESRRTDEPLRTRLVELARQVDHKRLYRIAQRD